MHGKRSQDQRASLGAAGLALGATVVFGSVIVGQETPEVLPAGHERVIGYLKSDDLADPVAQLKRDVESGKVKLTRRGPSGYLESVLQALGVNPDTQCLVFSKTSAQRDLISSKTPRAVYFNDRVYVGYVQNSDHLEIASIDPQKGTVFYTVTQGEEPAIQRTNQCITCHLGPKTLNVPGVLVRSSLSSRDGTPRSQITEFTTGHMPPLRTRWAGWYVTGKAENDVHLGNSFLEEGEDPAKFDPRPGSGVMRLSGRFDTSPYPRATSDIVALMLLDDSVRMNNLITAASYETRLTLDELRQGHITQAQADERIKLHADALLDYLLFNHETPLKGPVVGTANIPAWFAKGAPRDQKGRSLKDLDMRTRMFKYPCHYLIYSDHFAALPPTTKHYLFERLVRVLNNEDPGFPNLSRVDRTAIREILVDTLPGFRELVEQTGRPG